MAITAGFLVPHPPLIVPDVGGGKEREMQTTIESYREVARRIAALRPETVVILTPHANVYADYIHISPGERASGSLARFGAPAVTEVAYDAALVRALCALCDADGIAAGTQGEREPQLDHGMLVPLHFIRAVYTGCQYVRIAPSGLTREEHYRFGMLLQGAVERLGRSVVVVASGDLSHRLTADGPYGFTPEGPQLDRVLTEIIQSGEFESLFTLPEQLCEAGAECGLRPLLMLAGALDGRAVAPELLSYEGPFGVGYAVAAFPVGGEEDSRRFLQSHRARQAAQTATRRDSEDAYTRLARETLETYTRTGKLPPLPDDLPPALVNERAGVFVSIKKNDALRGCIGTIEPTRPSIAEEIRHNAVAAGTQDPRFDVVKPEELDALTYSVDVLTPAEPCDPSMLDPARYGVIVTSGYKRGLLLPDLEGIDTVEQQLEIARRKARIADSEACTYARFEVVRHL